MSVDSFARALLADWPPGVGLDGADLMGMAVRHELLVEVKVVEPCRDEGCACMAWAEPHEWVRDVACYRPNPALREGS